MNIKSRIKISKKLLAVFISLYVSNVYAEAYYFDDIELKTIGLSKDAGNTLLKSDKFQPGTYHVNIVLNNLPTNYHGKILINNNGSPCITGSLLEDIGINISRLAFDHDLCLKESHKEGVFFYTKPKSQSIEIYVPISYLLSNERTYSHGGTAAIFNYNIHALNSRGKFGNTNNYTAFLTSGFNTDDWIFRNKTIVSSYDGNNDIKNSELFAQKTFDGSGKTLKVGSIDSFDQFYGMSLIGLNLSPESTFSSGMSTTITGFSNDDSQVEIYQAGQLVYVGQVRAGRYNIDSVPVLNTQTPFEVVLVNQNGTRSKRTITTAEALINLKQKQSNGFSLSIGKANDFKSSIFNEPVVLTTNYGWDTLGNYTFSSGSLITNQFYSLAGSVTYSSSSKNNITLTNYVSYLDFKDNLNKKRIGNSSSITLSNQFYDNVKMTNAFIYRTSGYRGIEDLSSDDFWNYKWQQTNSIFASLKSFGTFGLTYSLNERSGHRENSYGVSWGTNIYKAYLSTSIQKQRVKYKDDYSNETRFYAQLSIPLSNNQGINSSYSSGKKWSRTAVDYRQYNSNTFNYGLGYANEQYASTSINAGYIEASKTFRTTHVGARYNFNQNYKSLASYASGGLLINNNAITLSPYEIGDTFALIRVGNYPGIELQTPNGKVWTDNRGNAVASNLNPYTANQIQVVPENSPRNIDVMQGIKKSTPFKGSVNQIRFDAKKVQRLLVYAVDALNKPLPYNAEVVNLDDNTIMGFVDHDGLIFFSDIPSKAVKVNITQNQSCIIDFSKYKKTEVNEIFSTTHLTCK
ncbi:TPA: fimbria/pilus outer membrane usher protein [Escherichia coli]|uniref:Pilin outer membrane usher protein SafC n=7 Tax=Escherichia coli TaxID=562 RepID=A0ABC8E7N2_ECOLX|nr:MULTISPECIES: fimbria/pilus outer membrane usher protein [Escherichia]EFL9915061.1 fimbria/pilus outer membrane usher protein [Escherichia coli]EHK1638755.1 fimbria/pilus outer membrane usher protein [Escherichia coli]EHK2788232.1 fimbria/pilus outer membrane usher protein [Escherichia coli]EHM0703255.1 fimbria/pilus outer membrane usher protein [Escherichia coli]EHT4255975.1 fimbria/pilus outer membrane usher protein [Escherichia coli]